MAGTPLTRPGLWLLSGAPGAGKSTTIPYLVSQNPGGLVIADFDELLTGGALLGLPIAASNAVARWPAYNELWLRIASLIRRSGTSVVLSCPLVPGDISASGTGFDASWLLLDCSDDERTRRLDPRGWPVSQVTAALADAAELRRVIPDRLDTTGLAPADVARGVYRWIGAGRAGTAT